MSKTLLMTNNYVRRLSVLWTTAAQRDGLTVAVGVHVVVVHTRTTPVNDETTPSRLPKRRWYSSKLTDVSMKVRLQTFNYSPSFTEALSIKKEAQSIKYSVLNPKRPTPARTASRTRSRETPDTDAPSPRRPRRAAWNVHSASVPNGRAKHTLLLELNTRARLRLVPNKPPRTRFSVTMGHPPRISSWKYRFFIIGTR